MGSSVLPGADPFGPALHAALSRSRAPGHLGRADRRAVEADPRGARRVRARVAALAAQATGEARFEREIVPVPATEHPETLSVDEGIRPDTTPERLAALKPAFKADGVITAGNSSQISDGAAAVLVTSEEAASRLGPPAAGPVRRLRARRRRPDPHAHRADPGHRRGARACQARPRRRRPDRDQRGVRQRGAGLGARGPPRHGPGQRERRRDRARSPARLLGRPHHGHAALRARAQRRPHRPPDACARAAAWRTPRSSSGCSPAFRLMGARCVGSDVVRLVHRGGVVAPSPST